MTPTACMRWLPGGHASRARRASRSDTSKEGGGCPCLRQRRFPVISRTDAPLACGPSFFREPAATSYQRQLVLKHTISRQGRTISDSAIRHHKTGEQPTSWLACFQPVSRSPCHLPDMPRVSRHDARALPKRRRHALDKGQKMKENTYTFDILFRLMTWYQYN